MVLISVLLALEFCLLKLLNSGVGLIFPDVTKFCNFVIPLVGLGAFFKSTMNLHLELRSKEGFFIIFLTEVCWFCHACTHQIIYNNKLLFYFFSKFSTNNSVYQYYHWYWQFCYISYWLILGIFILYINILWVVLFSDLIIYLNWHFFKTF